MSVSNPPCHLRMYPFLLSLTICASSSLNIPSRNIYTSLVFEAEIVCECQVDDESDLTELTCENKQLTSFPDLGSFDCTFNKVDISGNYISLVTKDGFINTPQLQVIAMHNNGIENIEIDTFSTLEHLEEVDLTDNHLEYIHPDIFVNNKALKKVMLSGNPLVSISETRSILNSPSITTHDLSDCKLKKLNSDMLANLPNLQMLDFSSNNLQVIPTNTFACKPFLKYIEFHNNHWICGCAVQSLVDFVTNLRKTALQSDYERVGQIMPVKCYQDNSLDKLQTNTESEDCQEESLHTTDCYSREPPAASEIEQVITDLPVSILPRADETEEQRLQEIPSDGDEVNMDELAASKGTIFTDNMPIIFMEDKYESEIPNLVRDESTCTGEDCLVLAQRLRIVFVSGILICVSNGIIILALVFLLILYCSRYCRNGYVELDERGTDSSIA